MRIPGEFGDLTRAALRGDFVRGPPVAEKTSTADGDQFH